MLKKVLVFAFCMSISPFISAAQVKNITLQVRDKKVEDIIKQLRQESGYAFLFNHEEIKDKGTKTLDIRDRSIEEVLHMVLEDTGLQYEKDDDVFVISPVKEQVRQQDVNYITITGSVKDRSGTPLPGATVRLKDISIGTSVGADGNFNLRIPETPNAIIVFSFIGMRTVEIPFTGNTVFHVVLEEDVQEADEVVVTGIFTRSRESYTGAVTTISSAELAQFKGRNLISTIGNIDPSFYLATDNFSGSNPNMLPNISIRGASSLPNQLDDLKEENRNEQNTPLIILDGFEITLEKMMDINENTIESITILKDAAASALYGSKAANGVVVITSKLPEAGKLRITYRGDLNIETPDLSDYNLTNAREKLALEYRAGLYNGNDFQTNRDLQDLYNQRLADVERGVDTYWLAKPLRTSVGHTHYLGVEGGSEEFRYMAALRYNNYPGVMKGSGRETVNGDLTISYNFKNVIFRNSFNITNSVGDESPYGNFSKYAQANPYFKPYDDEGVLYKSYPTAGLFGTQYNPLYDAYVGAKADSKYTDFTNNFAIEWTPLDGLRLRGRISWNRRFTESNDFKPADHTDFDNYSVEDVDKKGSYRFGTGDRTKVEASFNAVYSRLFAEKHQMDLGLDLSMKNIKGYNYIFEVEGFDNPDIDFVTAALRYKEGARPSGADDIERQVGFLGNAVYIYDNRYFAEGSLRVDGSSKFGADNRFAPFWSVGAGWNVHNENFFTWTNYINRLRLRLTYGITGSDKFSNNQAITTYRYGDDNRYGVFIGANVEGIGNEKLKWQKTKEFNVGLEMAALNSRLTFNADIYNKRTDNLLADMDLPLSTGFMSYKENIGVVENRGFELKASGWIIRNTAKNLAWSVTGTLVRNRNKIVEISDALKEANNTVISQTSTDAIKILVEGESQNTLYTVKSLGIDPATGLELYQNRYGLPTYNWSYNDIVATGNSDPDYRGILSTILRYKDLTFTASFGYQWGGQRYNTTLIEKVENARYYYNVDRRVYDARWQNPGDVTFFKSLDDRTPTRATSRFIQDENIFECKNLSLRYEFGNWQWVKDNLKTNSLSLSFNANDLFYLSSIKQERGTTYPFARRFSFTLSAMF